VTVPGVKVIQFAYNVFSKSPDSLVLMEIIRGLMGSFGFNTIIATSIFAFNIFHIIMNKKIGSRNSNNIETLNVKLGLKIL
jgi:hypothetical protein